MVELTIDGDVLKLSGLLNVDTVNNYYDPGLKAIDKHGSLTVDLSGAEIVGSAGVALLIAWQRRSLELEKQMQIIHAPEHFIKMALVSGVKEILPFSDVSN